MERTTSTWSACESLTAGELAQLMHLAPQTLRAHARKGDAPEGWRAIRIGSGSKPRVRFVPIFDDTPDDGA